MPSVDHRDDPAAWARVLGVSREAIDLYLASDVIDLHVDSFIWHRLFGKNPLERQRGLPLLPGVALGHADLPRLREAQIGGATWVMTTNPFREGRERVATFLDNVARVRALLAG